LDGLVFPADSGGGISKIPAAPGFVKSLVQKLENLGLTPEFKRSLIMRWTGADGRQHRVINIRKFGRVMFEALSWQLRTDAEHALAPEFRQSIAGLLDLQKPFQRGIPKVVVIGSSGHRQVLHRR
jgi:hypothetical protein